MQMKRREWLFLPAICGFLFLAVLATERADAVGQSDNTPDVIEIRHYQLTVDKAEKAATAMESINKLTAENPAIKEQMDASAAGSLPITKQAENIDAKFPQVAAIIHAGGFATREFIVVIGAIMNDSGFVGLKKQGLIKEYPAKAITPENAALVEENWDKFKAIAAKMAPLSSQ